MRKYLLRVEWIALAAIFCGFVITSVAQTQSGAIPPGKAVATFAGGCFWCMEPPFDKIPGVVSTTSGYTGGKKRNPSYEEVSSGTTGPAEPGQGAYDPTKGSSVKLLDMFWH